MKRNFEMLICVSRHASSRFLQQIEIIVHTLSQICVFYRVKAQKVFMEIFAKHHQNSRVSKYCSRSTLQCVNCITTLYLSKMAKICPRLSKVRGKSITMNSQGLFQHTQHLVPSPVCSKYCANTCWFQNSILVMLLTFWDGAEAVLVLQVFLK